MASYEIEKLKANLSAYGKSVVDEAAKKANDKDGVITGEEISIFNQYIKEHYDAKMLSREDYITIQRGGKPVEEEKPVSEKKAERQADRADKKEFKSAVKAMNEYLQDIADKNITREDLVAELETRINNQKDDTRYIALMNGVKNILAVVNEMELNSPYEVDNNITAAKIRKALKEKGLETEGTKALLDDNTRIQANLREMVKTELQQAAYADITKVYAEVVAEQKAAGKKVVTDEEVINGELKKDDVVVTDKDILKIVKERLADKMRNGEGHKHDYQNSFDKAFDAYVNSEVMKHARVVVLHAFDDKLGLNDDKMTREVRKNLKDSGVWDKYIKKAYNHDMGGKAIAHDQALENNLKVHRYQSEKEVRKAVGDVIFEALVSQGLITKNADGDYDLKVLQDLIRTQVGGDKTLSAAADVNEKIAEKLRTNSKLVMNTKLSELTDKEVKKMVIACGFDVDGPQWGKALLALLGGAAVGAAAGAGSAYTNPTQVFHKDPDKIFHNLNLNVNINGDFDLGNITGLPEGAEIIKTGTGISVKLSQLIETAGFFEVASKFVGLTALKVGAIGAAIGLIEGLAALAPKGEKAVIPTSYPEEGYEEYIQRVILENEKTPHIAEIVAAIATSFKNEKGEWDKVAYVRFLNTAGAGDGSPLNKAELLSALRTRLAELKATPEPVKNEEPNEEKPIVDNNTINIVEEKLEPEKPIKFIWASEHNWHAIVAAYYPELKNKDLNKMKPAVDAFRRGHGISLNSNTPVGQLMQLKPIVVNGVEYKPKQCTKEELADAIKNFGWKCGYFSPNYKVKTTHTVKLKVTSYNDNGKTVYNGTLVDANGKTIKRISGAESVDSAKAALRPEASTTSDINLVINVTENGKTTTETEVIKKR